MDEPKQELRFCENCKKDVSAGNFLMHSAHCQRKISLCGMCNEPFPKSEIAAHITQAHAKVKCAKCGKEVEQQDVKRHNTEDCMKRLLRCNYCDIEVRASEQSEHEDYCGSRTERCDECGQYVMLKYLDIHVSSNHSFLTIEDFDKQHNTAASSASIYSGLKNFNSNKDQKEPLSMQPDFGIGKRTNVMPQINLNENIGRPKETSKPILRDLYAPQAESSLGGTSGMSTEQLDRLLALHLAEDDYLSPSYFNSDPEDAFPTSCDVTGSGAFMPAEDLDDSEDLQDTVATYGEPGFPHEWENRQGMGRNQEPESSPIRPVSQLIKPPEYEASSALPCEFCNKLYSADQLLDHQRLCEFAGSMRSNPARGPMRAATNIADRLFSSDLNNSKNVEKNHQETAAVLNNFSRAMTMATPASLGVDEACDIAVMIPCEYCGTQFDVEYIIEHESGCGFMEGTISPAPLPPLPAPTVVNRDPRYIPTQVPVKDFGGERKRGIDPQMDFLDDLYLKEAIENSLKDKDVSSEAPPPVLQSPVVRRIPIKVEPGYSPRHQGAGLPPAAEELNGLDRMRDAKAKHASGVVPLVAARRFDQPKPSDRLPNPYTPDARTAATPANIDPTGARPKSFARRTDAEPPGDLGAECPEDARTNGRHFPHQTIAPTAAPIPRPRRARPSSTPAARQVKSKQQQY